MPTKRKKASPVLKALVSLAVMTLYLTVGLGVPVVVTKIIFQQGDWLARMIVYLVCVLAIFYGIKESSLDLSLYQWIKKKLGIRIF